MSTSNRWIFLYVAATLPEGSIRTEVL